MIDHSKHTKYYPNIWEQKVSIQKLQTFLDQNVSAERMNLCNRNLRQKIHKLFFSFDTRLFKGYICSK